MVAAQASRTEIYLKESPIESVANIWAVVSIALDQPGLPEDQAEMHRAMGRVHELMWNLGLTEADIRNHISRTSIRGPIDEFNDDLAR